MSTCISLHGEYGEHTPDADYTCTRCATLDEDALIAEVRQLRELVRQRDEAVDSAQRELTKMAWHADLNARVEYQGRVAGLERQLRCVQLYGVGYLLKHGTEQLALNPADVTVVLPAGQPMTDLELRARVAELEARLGKVRERCDQTSSSYRETAWELAEELCPILDGPSPASDTNEEQA